MKIMALADQHGELPQLPEEEFLLLLIGDITGGNWSGSRDGSEDKWNSWLHREFRDWVGNRKVIATAGNHDTIFQKYPFPDFIHFLKDDFIIVNDTVIYGTPWIKYFDGLAFNADEKKLDQIYSQIPNKVDILMTHGPPFGFLDVVERMHVGSKMLLKHIERVNPKIVICGHIHQEYGRMIMPNGTVIYNVARKLTLIQGGE